MPSCSPPPDWPESTAMSGTAVDYSWSRPDPACLRSAGYGGAFRYLSYDASKNLTRGEVDALHAAGLWVGLNWEGRGNWSEFASGYAGGIAAGRVAAGLANQMAAPARVPIFASYDTQASGSQWPTIADWLRGFTAATGRPTGFYGQGNLADWLVDRGVVAWIWQTNASGWGGISSRAVIRQRLWTTVCGASVDPNIVIGNPTDWAWMPNQPQEEDMSAEQVTELLAVAKDTQGKAGGAWLYSQRAMTCAIEATWQAHGGINAGLVEIYQLRLGRKPDPTGLGVWSKAAAGRTYAEVDALIAGSSEAKKRAAG